MLDRWRAGRPEIAAHDVVTRAMRRSGRADFGGEDWSLPLEELCRSLDREARLTPAGRRAARDELVDVLVSRVAPPTDGVAGGAGARGTGAPVVVTGLPGSGADDVARALGRHRPDAVEAAFVSLDHEIRYHVPAYAEWLDTADLRPAYAAARRRLDEATGRIGHDVIAGAVHLAHPDLVREELRPALVVVVDRDPDDCVIDVVAASTEARRRTSTEVDPGRVLRYWRWRVESLAEHRRGWGAAGDLVVPAGDPAAIALRVRALVARRDAGS